MWELCNFKISRLSVLANLGRTDCPVHILILTAKEPLGSDEPGPFDCGYIKSHSASLDNPFNPYQFQKCRLPSRIISNTQVK
ncbi:hypothetical protein YC2023_023821 [Brassica napus]